MSVPKLRFKADDGSEFPEWEEWCLGDICDIKTGPFGSTLHASDYVENGTPIVTTEHFKYGSLPITKQGIPQVGDRDIHKLSSYSLQQGDIVFSRVGSIDVNALVTPIQKGWLFSGRVLRVRPSEDINCVYLHYELLTARVRKNITDRAVGQTMPSLNTDILKKTQVFMPSGCEQQKIAVCLSVIDNVIDQTQSEIDAWEKHKRGVMQLLFSRKVRFKADDGSEFPEWEEKTLGECCECLDNMRIPVKKSDRIPGPFPYYGSTNIQDYVNDYLFDEPLVLLAEDAGPFDDFANKPIAQFVNEKCWVNNHAHVLRPKDNPKYVFYSLEHKDIRMFINSPGRGKLNQEDMNGITIPYPCLAEQQKIATCLSAFDGVIDKTKKELDAYRELKKGLLQQMFV